MSFEPYQRAHRHVELAQSLGPAEIRQIDYEASRKDLRTQLAQQLDGTFGGATGRDQVVDQNDAITVRNRVLVHFHFIEPVLQRIGDGNTLVRELALLADGHEPGGNLV